MSDLDLRLVPFFAVAIFALAILNGVLRAFLTAKYIKTAAQAGKASYKNGGDTERIQESIKEAMMKEATRQREQAAKHPAIVALSAVQSLVFLGFLAYFFHLWMLATARDLLPTPIGQAWYRGVMGVFAITGGYAIFRTFAVIAHLNATTIGPDTTEPSPLALAADPRSPWAKLQNTLIILSIITFFVSVSIAATRIILLSSTPSSL